MKHIIFEQQILSSYMWNYLHSKFKKISESLETCPRAAIICILASCMHDNLLHISVKENWKGTSHIKYFSSVTQVYWDMHSICVSIFTIFTNRCEHNYIMSTYFTHFCTYLCKVLIGTLKIWDFKRAYKNICQFWWGFQQNGLLGGVPAHWTIFKVPSNPTHSITVRHFPILKS